MLNWNTSHRLWYVGKDEMLLILTNQPGTLSHGPTLEAQDFTSKWSIDLWRTITLLARSTLGVPTLFMQRRRPETMLHRSSLILRSRRSLLCSNLKYSQFVHVPCPWKIFASSCTRMTYAYAYQFSTYCRFASCFLLSDLDVRLPSKLRMWKSSKRLWRTRGMTSFKGRQKCCRLFHKCGEMIAIPNLICQCKSNFPGRTHEA